MLDNSAKSTNPFENETYWNSGVNNYACENTYDKIFLLSVEEVTNSAYGFTFGTAIKVQTNDYSRATGVFMNTQSSYYGIGSLWLRSPDSGTSIFARTINSYGGHSNDGTVYYTQGVVPAMWINLNP